MSPLAMPERCVLELNGKTLAPIGPPGHAGKVTFTREDSEGSRGRRKLALRLREEIRSGRATRERKLAHLQRRGFASTGRPHRTPHHPCRGLGRNRPRKAARVLLTQPLPTCLPRSRGLTPLPKCSRIAPPSFRAGPASPTRSPEILPARSKFFALWSAIFRSRRFRNFRRSRPAEHFPRLGGGADRFLGDQRRAAQPTSGVAARRTGIRGGIRGSRRSGRARQSQARNAVAKTFAPARRGTRAARASREIAMSACC